MMQIGRAWTCALAPESHFFLLLPSPAPLFSLHAVLYQLITSRLPLMVAEL